MSAISTARATLARSRCSLANVLWKDAAYRDEREVRIAFRDIPLTDNPESPGTQHWDVNKPIEAGRHLQFPVNDVVDEIIVAPRADPWVVELLKRLRDPLDIDVP